LFLSLGFDSLLYTLDGLQELKADIITEAYALLRFADDAFFKVVEHVADFILYQQLLIQSTQHVKVIEV